MLARALLLIGFLFIVFWFISSRNDETVEKEVTEVSELTSEEVVEGAETADSEDAEVAPSEASATTPVSGVATGTVVESKPVQTYVPARVTDVTVYMYEWNIDFSDKEIPSGTVNFTVKNNGSFSHDFVIRGIGNLGKVAPSETKTFTARLSGGTYEIYSDRREDYAKGMTDTITVIR